MEDHKNIKDDKNEKESPELKEELTDDELKGVTGGVQWTQQDYKEEEKLGLWYPGM
ncbi:bacteriocin [Synechococcus sp. UW179A]|uniref:bacteriocin n=1 Tax=Synechococcus sp. UW179A TaxID=2575510 RepID=UPI001481EE2C|nr:bacteriocin [Synechococcus sp. UW179A]